MLWKPTKPPFVNFKKKVFSHASKVAPFIYQLGEYSQLRKPSTVIPTEKIASSETQKKIAYLKQCMMRYRALTGYGRGIAAVQVGIPERFAVIYAEEKLLVIINPKITNQSQEQLLYPEMCMSAVPVIAPVTRPSWIEFTYYDEFGKRHEWKTKAGTKTGKMLNRVFEHEIDHLDGVINIDRVASPKELILESDPSFYQKANFVKISS